MTLDKAVPCSRGQLPVRDAADSGHQPIFPTSGGGMHGP